MDMYSNPIHFLMVDNIPTCLFEKYLHLFHGRLLQTYESVYPLLIINNITVKNRMVSNSINELKLSLNVTNFFVSELYSEHS